MKKTREQRIAELKCMQKRLQRMHDELLEEDLVPPARSYIEISLVYLNHAKNAMQLKK